MCHWKFKTYQPDGLYARRQTFAYEEITELFGGNYVGGDLPTFCVFKRGGEDYAGALKNSGDGVPFRVLIADDHEIFRMGVASFLRHELGCDICAETADGRDALKLAESTKPDVAVVDVGLPGLNGFDVTRQIRRHLPETEVVILSGDVSQEMTSRALEAGARAFILKMEAVKDLAGAVRAARDHRFYFTPSSYAAMQLRQPATGRDQPQTLTDREREIVQLLAEGKSNKEAAAILGLSVKTVETHRAAAMRKLKISRPSDLIRYAIRQKIIEA